MGYETKYELTKKRCKGGIFSEIEVFGQEMGHNYMLHIRFQILETDKRHTK